MPATLPGISHGRRWRWREQEKRLRRHVADDEGESESESVGCHAPHSPCPCPAASRLAADVSKSACVATTYTVSLSAHAPIRPLHTAETTESKGMPLPCCRAAPGAVKPPKLYRVCVCRYVYVYLYMMHCYCSTCRHHRRACMSATGCLP